MSDDTIRLTAVKAVGDWELEVLAVPYGGPNGGKDSDQEYFSTKTQLYEDQFTSPLITYYHGYDENGKPQGEPAIIGKVNSKAERRQDGVWYRILLDKASEYAKRIWEAAKNGLARASSGSIAHLVRKAQDGEILVWPIGEIALIDAQGKRQPANNYAVAMPVMKANYEKYGILFPSTLTGNEDEPNGAPDAVTLDSGATAKTEPPATTNLTGAREMDAQEILDLMEKRDAAKAAEAKKAADAAEVEKLRQENEALKAEAAKANRLPGGAPVIAKHSELWAYDNLDAGDMAVMVGVLEANAGNKNAKRPSEAAYKALAVKLDEDKTIIGDHAMKALRRAGYAAKSDEVDYSTLASYGDDWVGVGYSNTIWEAIRHGTPVVAKLPAVEVPQGVESINLPLESTDPTFYKVAENTTYDGTMKYPVPTITSSQMGTAKVSLTLGKLGGRVLWTGELAERSLIPFASQLRQQLQTVGAEYLESAVVDGDNVTTASTNINDIASTAAQGGTEYYLMFDGFRVSALVTTSANSRSAAGTLAVTDYINTLKLMGGGGINALDTSKVSFIIDPNTYYASLSLPEVLTRDVFASPTLEGGKLRGLYGYEIITSANMHRMSTVRKANSAGKVDTDVTTNNAYGAILGVRWDQWKFGFQRRMTMEVTRFAASDTNEIVAMMTCGLIQRDTEAASITYYVGV